MGGGEKVTKGLLEEADGARGDTEVLPVGEPAETPTAALLALASRLASGGKAAGPPPALGESDFRALLLQWGTPGWTKGRGRARMDPPLLLRGLAGGLPGGGTRLARGCPQAKHPCPAWHAALGDHYEKQNYGRVLVGQGPPGSATWRSHLGRPGAYGGKPLTPVAAHLLERPILLIIGTTASVQLWLYTLADAGAPHGGHYMVRRGDSGTSRA